MSVTINSQVVHALLDTGAMHIIYIWRRGQISSPQGHKGKRHHESSELTRQAHCEHYTKHACVNRDVEKSLISSSSPWMTLGWSLAWNFSTKSMPSYYKPQNLSAFSKWVKNAWFQPSAQSPMKGHFRPCSSRKHSRRTKVSWSPFGAQRGRRLWKFSKSCPPINPRCHWQV